MAASRGGVYPESRSIPEPRPSAVPPIPRRVSRVHPQCVGFSRAWGVRMTGFNPDVIVVGGGAAGAVVARRLVDRGDVRVLLLEAGGRDTNPAIHDPRRVHELWLAEENWAYETAPQEYAAGRRLAWPRGRVLGGSSCLNAMVWVRGAPEDFDTWAYLGADGWSWRDVLPVYERIERREPSGPGTVSILSGFEPDPIDV